MATEPTQNSEYRGQNKFMTKDQFKIEVLSMMLQYGPSLYLEATEIFVAELENILQSTSDYEQLKKELLNVCSDRKDFISFASDNTP